MILSSRRCASRSGADRRRTCRQDLKWQKTLWYCLAPFPAPPRWSHRLAWLRAHGPRWLLLQPPRCRCDKPTCDCLHAGGQARRSVGQRTASSTPPSFPPPRARLARHLGGFVTNPHEQCARERSPLKGRTGRIPLWTKPSLLVPCAPLALSRTGKPLQWISFSSKRLRSYRRLFIVVSKLMMRDKTTGGCVSPVR